MLRALTKFGDLLDTLDLGGWACTIAGTLIIAVTVLAPAWLDVRQLKYEHTILRRQASALDARLENYEGFVDALESDDPMLLTRLAWHHLHLKPASAEVAQGTWAPEGSGVRIDEWMRPAAAQLPALEPVPPLPDSKLVRLLLGAARPWVLAFGGWVLLIGLLVTPRKTAVRRTQTPASVCSAPLADG